MIKTDSFEKKQSSKKNSATNSKLKLVNTNTKSKSLNANSKSKSRHLLATSRSDCQWLTTTKAGQYGSQRVWRLLPSLSWRGALFPSTYSRNH